MGGKEVKIYEGEKDKDVKCLTKELKFPVHSLQSVKEAVKGKRSAAGRCSHTPQVCEAP